MILEQKVTRFCAISAVLLMAAMSADAQERRPPEEGGTVYSLGQPGRNLAHGGLTAGVFDPKGDRSFAAYVSIASYRDLIHPAYTIVGLWGELYAGLRDMGGAVGDGGARGLLYFPQFRLGAGVDYNFRDDIWDAIITSMIPIRRGGIFGHGTMLRIDWLPGRGQSFNIGIEMALQRYSGETRPKKDNVKLPKGRKDNVDYEVTDPTLDEALARVRDAAHWINRLTVPFLDHKGFTETKGLSAFDEEVQTLKTHMASTAALYPNGRTIHEEVRVYHDEIDRAFSIAVSNGPLEPGESTQLGRTVSARAKEVLLEEIIMRYDRLLGQRKKNDTVMGLAVNARGIFARWLTTDTTLRDARKDAVLYVFRTLIDIIEENRKWSRKKWNDARLVWIPMQYALRPEQHDTQKEMDRLIERTTRHEFTPGNDVFYIINEQFQAEVHKMIMAAEDYHVLWIHDFRGVDAAGDPDEISFRQVLHSYFGAMTKRVKAYDETGKLPVYLIVQDQFYYENNKSKRWYKLLRNMLDYNINLPKDYEWMETALDSAQAELRKAVEDSYLLQSEAREYGEGWLEDRVKVHINITQPADASFWSSYIVPIVGIHDTYIRDHRKISFYDISEENPYKGGAIYTGMGIGEHYTGPTWEDRGILAKGPALLDLRDACTELLMQNGFEADEIPHVLRPKAMPANYDAMVAAGPPDAEGIENTRLTGEKGIRAMELHNVVGYGPKRCSVFKAMIYTLMPPRSVLLMPDFVWQSPLWGSMAVGGALRGTRSLIVYPSLENQPSPSGLPQSRARELFRRLIRIQHVYADEISASGGLLKTGFYNLDVDVKDLRGRINKAAKTIGKNPFLRELVHGEDVDIADVVEALNEALDRAGYEVHQYTKDAKVRQPQLHLKAQFYASSEAWDTFFSFREVKGTSVRHILAWAKQLSDESADPTEFQEAMAPVIRSFREEVEAKMTVEEIEKAIVYLTVGSQNMDYRGMFLDGEVVFVTTQGGVLTGVLDLLHVIQVSDWIDNEAALDEYIGSFGWMTRQLGRWATPLM